MAIHEFLYLGYFQKLRALNKQFVVAGAGEKPDYIEAVRFLRGEVEKGKTVYDVARSWKVDFIQVLNKTKMCQIKILIAGPGKKRGVGFLFFYFNRRFFLQFFFFDIVAPTNAAELARPILQEYTQSQGYRQRKSVHDFLQNVHPHSTWKIPHYPFGFCWSRPFRWKCDERGDRRRLDSFRKTNHK